MVMQRKRCQLQAFISISGLYSRGVKTNDELPHFVFMSELCFDKAKQRGKKKGEKDYKKKGQEKKGEGKQKEEGKGREEGKKKGGKN